MRTSPPLLALAIALGCTAGPRNVTPPPSDAPLTDDDAGQDATGADTAAQPDGGAGWVCQTTSDCAPYQGKAGCAPELVCSPAGGDTPGQCVALPVPEAKRCKPAAPCKAAYCDWEEGCLDHDLPDQSPCTPEDGDGCLVGHLCDADGQCIGGFPDCGKAACAGNVFCEPLAGCAQHRIGCGHNVVTHELNPSWTDQMQSYGPACKTDVPNPYSGPERAYQLIAPAPPGDEGGADTSYEILVTLETDVPGIRLFVLPKPTSGSCAPVQCEAAPAPVDGVMSWKKMVRKGDAYVLVVDSLKGVFGKYQLSVSCPGVACQWYCPEAQSCGESGCPGASCAKKCDASDGEICFDGLCTIHPPNDTCEQALPLVLDTAVAGSTAEAADSYGFGSAVEKCADQAYGKGAPDVAYVLAPEADGIYEIELAAGSTEFDSALYVVASCADVAGTCLAGENHIDPSGNATMGGEKVVVKLDGGSKYYVIVDGAGDGSLSGTPTSGKFVLSATASQCNWKPDHAVTLEKDGDFRTFQHSNAGAQSSFDIPWGFECNKKKHGGGGGTDGEVVYTVTSVFDTNLVVTVDPVGSDFAPVVTISTCLPGHTASCLDISPAAGKPDAVTGETVYTAAAAIEAGKPYFVLVDGSSEGSYDLRLESCACPEEACEGCGGVCNKCTAGKTCQNGLCAGAGATAECEAAPAAPLGMAVQGDTGTLGDDFTPPVLPKCDIPTKYAYGFEGRDAVYRFAAPEAGQYSVEVFDSAFDSLVYVLTDCAQVTESCIDWEDDGPAGDALGVTLEKDQVVYVVVDSAGGGAGTFWLRVSACEPDCTGKACGGDGCGGSCGECPGADPGPESVCVGGQCVLVPAHASCVSAAPVTLAGDTTTIEGQYTYGAGDEYPGGADPGPGACKSKTGSVPFGAGAPEVVYQFAVLEAGTYGVFLTGADFDAGLYVSTACGTDGWYDQCLAAANAVEGPGDECVNVAVEAGATHYVVVDGGAPGTEGSFDLVISKTETCL